MVAVKRVASLADRTILKSVDDVVGSSRYVEYLVQSDIFEVHKSSMWSFMEAVEIESVAATGSKFNDVEKSQLLALIMSFLARSRFFSSVSSPSPNANLIWSALLLPAWLLQRINYYLYQTTLQKHRREVKSHGRSNSPT